jgi:hypothetical protein
MNLAKSEQGAEFCECRLVLILITSLNPASETNQEPWSLFVFAVFVVRFPTVLDTPVAHQKIFLHCCLEPSLSLFIVANTVRPCFQTKTKPAILAMNSLHQTPPWTASRLDCLRLPILLVLRGLAGQLVAALNKDAISKTWVIYRFQTCLIPWTFPSIAIVHRCEGGHCCSVKL